MKPTQGLLERVAARVLAEAAYLFVEPLRRDPPEVESWPASGARVAFSGPARGYVEIWAPDEVARQLAANMLGQELDAPEVDETFVDAMMETLNVICGNLLAELAGQEPLFRLGAPRACRRLAPLEGDGAGVDAWLQTGGHALLVRMQVAARHSRVA
ncbi:MAG: chemotaxis protein CheX [Candidatus Eisenbacteria bacterium]|uniref:Chemotaxis protein CheX n=1 Tax=Eiseniibacteriota bacterium TaxID=2212470 RepID=A0A937X998_UNCEI|nr:chemotaxis protein CheX [Candidatus Eisenbacteria bacterium]